MCGVQVDDDMISTLLYADGIALIAPSEKKLQLMLDCVYNWCTRWRLSIYVEKTMFIQNLMNH